MIISLDFLQVNFPNNSTKTYTLPASDSLENLYKLCVEESPELEGQYTFTQVKSYGAHCISFFLKQPSLFILVDFLIYGIGNTSPRKPQNKLQSLGSGV